ncbi:MAG: hypothetical protein HY820_36170 [Acidobacteria bacterium]|nr:hypothetical protein [Acidobacteriota bacterium]
MKLAKRTYSLPYPIVERFEQALSAGNRSAFLAKLIEEWLAEQERAELRRHIIEGCQAMAEVNLEIDAEWNSVSEEVWRSLDCAN